MQDFLCLWPLCPSELSVKAVQLLGLQGPWRCQVCRDMDCHCCRSHGPIRAFCRASCSWPSEGLFGQSSSEAPPIQALRGLPCLGSFSGVLRIRHIDGHPWLGSFSVVLRVRHIDGHPWLGSYSVAQRVRHLRRSVAASVPQAFDGRPLCCSAANAGMWERGCGDGSTPYA